MALESHEEMLKSTNMVELCRYCKDAALENAVLNDAAWASWYDGRSIAQTYLEGNSLWEQQGHEAEMVEYYLQLWLEMKQQNWE